MAKVVFKKLKLKSGASKKRVTIKRIRDAEGAITTYRVVNVDSESLPGDLRYVFSKNVLRARQDNKQKIGSTDFVPRKA